MIRTIRGKLAFFNGDWHLIDKTSHRVSDICYGIENDNDGKPINIFAWMSSTPTSQESNCNRIIASTAQLNFTIRLDKQSIENQINLNSNKYSREDLFKIILNFVEFHSSDEMHELFINRYLDSLNLDYIKLEHDVEYLAEERIDYVISGGLRSSDDFGGPGPKKHETKIITPIINAGGILELTII